MDKVQLQAERLVEEIKNSDAYRTLAEVKKRIDTAPLKSRLEAFDKESFAIEMKRLNGEVVTFEEERMMGQLYAEVYLSEDGRLFLESQKALFDTVNQVYQMLEAVVKMEVQEEESSDVHKGQ